MAGLPSRSTELTEPDKRSLEQMLENGDFDDLDVTEELADFDFDSLDDFPLDLNTSSAQSNPTTPAQAPLPVFMPIPTAPAHPVSMMPPPLVPDMTISPAFDPRLGWYFRAMPTFAMPIPDALSAGLLTPQQIPRSQTPLTPLSGAVPAQATQPTASRPKASRSKPSRTFGPAWFFDEQERKKAQQDLSTPSNPQPSLLSEPNLPSLRKTEVPRKTSDAVVVQKCTCPEPEKPKRPMNSFMLYRHDNEQKLRQEKPGLDAPGVSKTLAERWRRRSLETHQTYTDLAKTVKKDHMAKYPDFKYKPGPSYPPFFGSEACTCGAYRVNMQAKREAEVALWERDFKSDSNIETNGKLTSRLPMGFNFDAVGEQRDGGAVIATQTTGSKRKHSAGRTDAAAPLPKRRSSRLNPDPVQNVPEANDDELFSISGNYVLRTAPGQPVANPPSSNTQPFSGANPKLPPLQTETPTQTTTPQPPKPDSPAYNTRNRAISTNPDAPSTGLGISDDTDDIDWGAYLEFSPTSFPSFLDDLSEAPLATGTHVETSSAEPQTSLRRSPRNAGKDAAA